MKRAVLAAVLVALVAAIAAVALFRSGRLMWVSDPPGRATTTTPIPPPASPESASDDHEMPPPVRGEVIIDAQRQQAIGVRTAAVRRASLAQDVRASGVVRFDETRQAEISTKVDGWIRDLRADYTGRQISRGELLFSLYSPGLIAAQNEYLLAHRGHASAATAELPSVRDHAQRLLDAARERLLRWDVSEADIRELEARGRPAETLAFRSPVNGTIVEKMAVEGMRVMAGQPLFKVADLSVVWVEANIPEQDLSLVRVGQTARVTVDAFPDVPLIGRTLYVYTTVEEQTRTAKVRFQFPNRGNRLKPGMFATVQFSAPGAAALTVPIDALLDSGTDQLVFVALGEGRFEPRPVKVGRRTREDVEITAGLKEGELVATGAAFFLDSESQLRGAVQSYQPAPGQPSVGTPAASVNISFRPQPDPPRTGENTLEVTVRDANGRPIDDADVSVTFFMPAMPTMNMPAMRNQARLPSAGGGTYRGSGQVMMAGRWDVTVDVSRGGQRLGSRQFTVVAK